MQTSDPNRSVLPKWLGPALAAILTLVLSACGGGGPGGGSVTVQLSDTALDVVLGGSGTVQVTVTRSAAATAALSLQASGVPGWVSVDFSPAVLNGATVESTMTVSTDAGHPDAEPTTFELTVEAVGVGLTASASLSVVVELQDVTGVVVDSFGAPVSGITVVTPGKTAVLTDADGGFTFAGMSAPYDLTVIDTDDSLAHQFLGLSTPAPRLQPVTALIAGLEGEFSASINGTLSHATLVPLPADHGLSVCVEGLDGTALGCRHDTADGATTYDIDVTWSAPAAINLRVRGYIYQVDADGVPTNIVASGTAGPTVLADGDAAALNLTLADSAGQATMPVTTTTPSGYTLASRGILSHYSEFGSFGLPSGSPVGTTDTVIAPFVSGATLSALAVATSNAPASSSASIAWSTGHTSGDSATLELPVPPTAIAPPDGATDVTTATEFSVANPSGGVVTFVVQPVSGVGPVYAVSTADTTATIPDLAAFGMGLPGAVAYRWAALSTATVPTMDAAVAGDGYLGGYLDLVLASSGGGNAPEVDGQIASTNSVEFTTQ